MKRLLLIIWLLITQTTSLASDRLLLYGTELSPESNYVYLGTIIPVEYFQQSYFIRLWSDFQTYSYEKNSLDIDAESRNVQLAFGKQFGLQHGWINIYLGYAFNNTELDPDDPANQSRGRESQLLVTADGEYNRASCDQNINYGVSYLLDQQAYWLRLRPICWTYYETGAGFEIVYHGDKEYNHIQLGGVIYNKTLNDNTSYTLKGGVTRTQDSDIFPYIGIEMTTRY